MSTGTLTATVTAQGHHDGDVRSLVHEACEPVAQFWPMKRFVHHNPIHGLEHLPFDDAVRQARSLLGGKGYLSNAEYRRLLHSGRISTESLAHALEREGPSPTDAASVVAGGWRVHSSEVWRDHLAFGFEPLEPMLLPWMLAVGLERFQEDLPDETRCRILDRWGAGKNDRRSVGESAYLSELWEALVEVAERVPHFFSSEGESMDAVVVALPPSRTVSDWLELLARVPVVEPINAQMIKWISAFVDEGMAGWTMPGREGGLYRAWLELAPLDWSGRLIGIEDFARKVRRLPDAPEAAIAQSLARLQVPSERRVEYLSRHLAQLPGWAGLVRWLGENPSYPYQEGHPADPLQYLAIRLFYEVELAEAICRRSWNIEATVPALVSYWQARSGEYDRLTGVGDIERNARAAALSRWVWPLFRLAQFTDLMPDDARELTPRAVQTLVGWLAAFPADRHGPVWLEAFEDTYRLAMVDRLVGHRTARPDEPIERATRARAQIVFCIDVRSESMRRHVEAQGPYETYGYAGFFGVTMAHEAFDGAERFPLCPVLLTPKHAVDETVRPSERVPLQSYASGTSWLGMGHHLLHDLKQHPLSSLMLVDAMGVFFGGGLVAKTLAPSWHQSAKATLRSWFKPAVGTQVAVDPSVAKKSGASALGFTIEEQAGVVEAGLRTIGLTQGLGRFVVLCGHGSETDNNPYFGALHCGACGGKHGDANARAFAAMGNHPEVRALLRARGLPIPDDTWFLPAKHITTSDRVEFYDLEDVPPSHLQDLVTLRRDLDRAGADQALERCGRLPQTPQGSAAAAYRHVGVRTIDWANTRPEWGLASNAAFIIGRRAMTKGLSLRGRAFLHSYDPDQDPDGAVLERIMTAPLVVGQWINMEHYFSAVDPWVWGSGSKVIHNVVSGVGVMLGSQSDLQTGLPLQTVNDGPVHYHEPLRLLTVIEAPTARISAAISKHAILQGLLHNQWLNLVAIDPDTFESNRYRPDGVWEAIRGGGEPLKP